MRIAPSYIERGVSEKREIVLRPRPDLPQLHPHKDLAESGRVSIKKGFEKTEVVIPHEITSLFSRVCKHSHGAVGLVQ
jgi:hypothetical protein